MLFGLWRAAPPLLMSLLICLALAGCLSAGDGQMDEQRNPHFIAGKERLASRDYAGAVAAFDKALVSNPRSALAHYELGLLHERQGERNENNFIVAMYHFKRAHDLRPNAYPADLAQVRLAACKQELLKADSLAPVAQTMQAELDRLREENVQLRKQIEAWQAQTASRAATPPMPPPVPAPAPARTQYTAAPSRPAPVAMRNDATNYARLVTPPPAVARRAHVVKANETASSIARLHRVKLQALMAANPNLDERRLRIGQSLNLPPP